MGMYSLRVRAPWRAGFTGIGGARPRAVAVGVLCAALVPWLVVGRSEPAGAVTSTVVVGTPEISSYAGPSTDWKSSDDVTAGPGNVAIVASPAGTGSAQFTVTPSTRAVLADTDPALAGVRFDEITALEYSTLRQTVDAGNNLAVTLQFDLDYDLTDVTTSYQSRVVFEPYFTAGSGNVAQNVWQSWTPLTGKWWANSSTPKVNNVSVAQACPQALPCTWAQFLAAYPDAGIRTAAPVMLLKAGLWSSAFTGNVGSLTLGINGDDTIYDFAPTTVVVGDGDLSPNGPWAEEPSSTTGDFAFVAGPATPPLGSGSLALAIDSGEHEALYNYSYGACAFGPSCTSAASMTPLTTIADLQYSTFRASGSTIPTLNIETYTTGVGGYTTLVFVPKAATISDGVWQTWDATNPADGDWVSSQIVPGVFAVAQTTTHTWAEIQALLPNAKVVFGLGPNVGTGGTFSGNVDRLVIGVGTNTTLHDFEPGCSAVCFVDAGSGNNANSGTAGDPFLTVQHGLTTVAIGGTVNVAAGLYIETLSVTKAVTLQGAGIDQTILDSPTHFVGNGIGVSGGLSGVTVADLTIRDYDNGITTTTGPIDTVLFEDLKVVDNKTHGIFSQAFGVTDYTLRRVESSRNNQAGGLSGRGFWMINGTKTDVTVEDGTFQDNGLVGIDISNGTVTGLSITNNVVSGSGDSGIGVLGAQGPGANLVAGNTVTNNGRFGIEIKMGVGNGAVSGPGSVVVDGNTVSRSIAATDARDYAGILVMRRSPIVGDPDQPSGVAIIDNSVSGFVRKPVGSTGDGFGIVVAGIGHVITGNTVTGNDVGVQVQGANTANVQSTPFFDRDDAAAGSATANRNAIVGNGAGMRTAGTGVITSGECNWWGAADGPSGSGPGTGDSVAAAIDFTPWLLTNNLAATCTVPSAAIAATASIVEGDAGSALVSVPVTLSNPTGATVTVGYATADITTVTPNDYAATTGTLTFVPGDTVEYATVAVAGGIFDEYDETFAINLTTATEATIGSPASSTVTIVNDDTPIASLSAGTVNVVEGNSGTQTVTLTVTLHKPSIKTISVNFATLGGTAVAPSDFVAAAGTVTFTPGQMAKNLSVSVKGDTSLEDYQSFAVALSTPVNATIGVGSKTVQILNDEKPKVTFTNVSVVEGQPASFAPILKQRYFQNITVNYATASSTAIAPGDFNAADSTITFTAGTYGPQNVLIPTLQDALTEGVEKFLFTVSGAAIVAAVTRTATIKANVT